MNSNHLAMAVSGLLYLGAVLAGWAGSDVAVWPLFLGVFVLWSILLRPGDWPRHPARWMELEVILRALAAVATMAWMSLACLVLGWILAQLSPIPWAGPWPGLLVSLVGIGAARLVWTPPPETEVQMTLEEALRQVDPPPPPDDAAIAAARQRREEAEVDAVIAFTDDTPPDRVAEAMVDLMQRFPIGKLVDGFTRLHKRGGAAALNAAQVRALVLLATDPEQGRRLKGYAAGLMAFQCCGMEPALLDLFARRQSALLEVLPEVIDEGPSNPMLRQMEKEMGSAPVVQVLRALRELQVRIAQRPQERAEDGDAPADADGPADTDEDR